MTKQKVIEFAKSQGYDTAKKLEPWHGFEVWEPLFDGGDVAFVGLPLLIFVDGDKIRMSTAEEAMQHLDEQ